jgi:hypothetical protein
MNTYNQSLRIAVSEDKISYAEFLWQVTAKSYRFIDLRVRQNRACQQVANTGTAARATRNEYGEGDWVCLFKTQNRTY